MKKIGIVIVALMLLLLSLMGCTDYNGYDSYLEKKEIADKMQFFGEQSMANNVAYWCTFNCKLHSFPDCCNYYELSIENGGDGRVTIELFCNDSIDVEYMERYKVDNTTYEFYGNAAMTLNCRFYVPDNHSVRIMITKYLEPLPEYLGGTGVEFQPIVREFIRHPNPNC